MSDFAEIATDAKASARGLARLIDRAYHAVVEDDRAAIENLAGMLRHVSAANVAMATEIQHYAADAERLRDERDEQVVRVQELKAEIAELAAELQELRAAAGPTDDSPITLECARIRDGLSDPDEAVLTAPGGWCFPADQIVDTDEALKYAAVQFRSAAAESDPPVRDISAEDPPADFDAVTAAYRAVMEWVDRPDSDAALIGCTPSMVAGIAVNAYRAALLSVSHEDLAALITGIQISCLCRGTTVDATYDEIARDLLATYRITKK